MKKTTKKRVHLSKRGFTLVEMLVVLIAVSGLMLLIIPNVSQSKDKIDEQSCTAYKELVSAQLEIYKIETNTDAVSITITDLVTENYISSPSCQDGTTLAIESGVVIEAAADTTTP